jgi:predicted hotdog family 3-hydroxylacyl-ACP dehydratase
MPHDGSNALIERAELASLIPHAGTMCLLDSVVSWDEKHIHCRSDSHRRADNPLRRDGQLSGVHLVEYAAQSMAVHGAVLARENGEQLAGGFLAALRGVDLLIARLDDLSAQLDVRSQQLMAGGGSLVYLFEIDCDGKRLASGRLTVVAQPDRKTA